MPDLKQTKILVAEDDPAMAEIVVHKLTTTGFSVRHASDGAKALEMFKAETPDIMLLDLMMPEMDGFQVLEAIRGDSDKKKAETPVIVLSNLWSNQDILKAKSLKADDYMVKAYFTTEEILNKINAILHLH
ncbi:MAG: response regulator [Candidatus Doudnabacteria bacterium]|nr:response regulator [Candidatus Doudnabacteria bacterium]